MAKKQERSTAKKYFVELGMTAKEIAARLNVSEQTLSKWVNDPKENWVEQRNARISTTSIKTEDIKQVINLLCEDRLNLDKQLKEAEQSPDSKSKAETIALLRKDMLRISDELSKWNKTLEKTDKDGKVAFSVYILVMGMIFDALARHNEKLYLQTIDFQEQHLNEVAARYR